LPATYSSYTNSTTYTLSSPFGSLPKNFGRTMPFYEGDIDINKKFSAMNDRIKIEFRSELYNITNHTNLYLPGGSGGSTATGTTGSTTNFGPQPVTGGSGGTITGTFEPRIVQFGLKIIY
jgi:hypothetical protein